ncbi:hypothetical protein [Wenzhouxiangella marina]|uniref:hypothetical protein n=1 Tax=Wenzhouxiangella marina TaxID=1579979 RepID=UPI000673B504|nr:hypothetical protein [Wenzhouxiangella marina]MBB6086698.1 hypothetical protein [Wenzhouxiangella marina]
MGPQIQNPSFELNGFSVYPGYARDNGPVIGWTGGAIDTSGLNPISDGQSPFADNGAIPAGSQVGFLQSLALVDATLSTTIAGLEIGSTYRVVFRANARSSGSVQIRVLIDGDTMNSALNGGAPQPFQIIAPVGGLNPYHRLAFVFTASAISQTLTIVNEESSDRTVLLDDFQVLGDQVFSDRFNSNVLGFDGLAQGPLVPGVINSEGPFLIENISGDTWAVEFGGNPDQALWLGRGGLPTVGDTLSIRLTGGGRFELQSLDYRSMSNMQSDGLDLVGLVDGQEVVMFGGLNSNVGTWQTLQPVFGVFVDEVRLVAASIGETSFLLDNLVVRPVGD